MFVEIAGWAGMIMTLLAYVLISFGKTKADTKLYQYLNLFGVIGLGINVFAKGAWPVLGLEIVWAGVAITALWRIYKKQK